MKEKRHRPKGAPSPEFHAAEIWISCGLVSRVFFTEASILARKQSGDVHYVELKVKQKLGWMRCWEPMTILKGQIRLCGLRTWVRDYGALAYYGLLLDDRVGIAFEVAVRLRPSLRSHGTTQDPPYKVGGTEVNSAIAT
jgi:hypothetical protein